MNTQTAKPIHWVATAPQLQRMIDALAEQPLLALDTEFMRTDTFYAKLALLQLSDGDSIWLVDFPALEDAEPLRKLLNRTDLTTLVHACGEDLEVLESALQVVPAKLFDTQLAAAYLNRGFSLGYARLVEQLCGVVLDKQATRSDWLQRPLTAQQRSYAACDVDFLHRLHGQLAGELAATARLDWFEEEMRALLATADERNSTADYYLKLTAAWEFSPAQLYQLDALCSWREQLARDLDLPRGRLFKDPQLLEAVRSGAATVDQLRGCADPHPASLRKFGEQLIDQLQRARREAAAHPVVRVAPPRPLTRAEGALFKALRSQVEQCAERLNIAKELLANKRELEQLVRQHSDGVAVEQLVWPQRLLTGWRCEQLKPLLSDLYQSSQSSVSGEQNRVV